jgi:hypothetical protein
VIRGGRLLPLRPADARPFRSPAFLLAFVMGALVWFLSGCSDDAVRRTPRTITMSLAVSDALDTQDIRKLDFLRRPVADIASLGEKQFAIAWIGADNCLYLKYSSSRFALAGMKQLIKCGATWVRANSGDAIRSRVVTPCRSMTTPRIGIRALNYFAFEASGEVWLLKIEFCAGWRISLLDEGPGYFPAMAWMTDRTQPLLLSRGLFVWAYSGILFGRFTSIRGQQGEPFVIDEACCSRSVDVVYNTVSQEFIVGYVARTGAFSCGYFNRRVQLDGATPGARTQFGSADCDVGGHATATASNADIANSSGVYAWSRQDFDGVKGVYVHMPAGELNTGVPTLKNAAAGTVPVSAGPAAAALYVAAIDRGCNTAHTECLMELYGFQASEGSLGWHPLTTWNTQLLPLFRPRGYTVPNEGIPLAVRRSGSDVVVVWGENVSTDPRCCLRGRFSVLAGDNATPP